MLKSIIRKNIQHVYNRVLDSSYKNRLERIKYRIYNKLFHFLLQYDPLIQSEIAGFILTLPLSHKLPFILRDHPQYSSNLARIAKYTKSKYDDLKLIDIGANVGDSIAIVRKEAYFPILCIEGDDDFFSVLSTNANNFENVYFEKQYLGENTENIQFSKEKLGGTGHLIQENNSQQIVEVKKLSEFIDKHPLFTKSKMIKIDTDGFDCKILRGSKEFLINAKPIIFFEYDPFFLEQHKENCLSIFTFLKDIGYQKLLIYDNVGFLLISADINNVELLQELHSYFSGRMSYLYCDICVFHQEDIDLFKIARKQELDFFSK